MRLALAIAAGLVITAIIWRVRIWWIARHSTLAGLEDIPQSHLPTCGQCGTRITKANDSGWQGFFKDTNGHMYAQKLCQACSDKQNEGGKIEE